MQDIFLKSHVSLAASIGLFLALMGFARAGGFGVVASSPDGDSAQPEGSHDKSKASNGVTYTDAYRMRSGGLATQVVFTL